jgi:serine/threonine protein phosphatase 1
MPTGFMVRTKSEVFAVLERPARVWALAAVHGDAARLRAVHDALVTRIAAGDRVVYLGNFLGYGPHILATMDELIDFRAHFLAQPGVEPWDIVHLRGAQEEMWTKLHQIQFAPNPREVLEWMLGQGVEATLVAYGGNPETARLRCREGTLALTRWTAEMRDAVRAHAGHDELLTSVRRYARTEDGRLVFVSAGLDPTRPLSEQGDAFWWGGAHFDRIEGPIGDIRRVVRGFDRLQQGVAQTEWRVTLDAGCGFGGPLVAACFLPDGQIVDLIQA